MKKTYNLNELSKIAQEIITLKKNNVLLFYGEMGVGKTTLIKEILKQLEVIETVSSPTFSLVNEHETKNNTKIYHFDFYRINSEEEAMDMGIEEYFYSKNLCLVEWPNKIENLLPLNAVKILLTQTGKKQRTIQLTNNE